MTTARKPTHPGVFLKEEILDTGGVSITQASKMLGMNRKALVRFLNERAKCKPIMAKKLSVFTGTTIGFWVNMQSAYDLWEASNVELEHPVTPLGGSANIVPFRTGMVELPDRFCIKMPKQLTPEYHLVKAFLFNPCVSASWVGDSIKHPFIPHKHDTPTIPTYLYVELKDGKYLYTGTETLDGVVEITYREMDKYLS